MSPISLKFSPKSLFQPIIPLLILRALKNPDSFYCMEHPFLNESFYIPWSQLTAEHVRPDIETALSKAQKKIDAIAHQDLKTLTFKNTLLALDNATEELNRAWSKVKHLQNVCSTQPFREASNAMVPKVSEFYARIFLNEQLWTVIKTFAATPEAQSLQGTRRRLLNETIADFEDNGADLSPEDKKRVKALKGQLAQVTQRYSENVLDATNGWDLIVKDEAFLAGLPTSARDAARQAACEKDPAYCKQSAWRFTLHMPSYLPAMQYLENDALRRQIWEAWAAVGHTRPYDNTELIWKILRLRHELAQRLGKTSFVDYILERRMVKNKTAAQNFTKDLHDRIEPAFQRECRELQHYKAEVTGQPVEPLQPWESAYWSEKQRQAHYAFDEETLRPYFPIDGVIKGLFHIAEKIFSIVITERPTLFIDSTTGEETENRPEGCSPSVQPVEVWHPEVKCYAVRDQEGTFLGSFYADWHPRESKQGGAWMHHLVTGGPVPDGTFEPHLGVICGNLTPTIDGRPALLKHREVETIFHEFGHLLHQLLGTVEIRSLNGCDAVWDFIELPSQIMENWCWERESLDLFARHYQTDEPIPQELFQKMQSARNYQAALITMRQLSFGKMDLDLHLYSTEDWSGNLDQLIEKSLATYSPPYKTQPPSIVRHFLHLFSSPTGYAAGYYSYKWAEVLDADAFTRFKKEGILNPEVGMDFRNKILSKGNSAPAEQLFRDFMGRDPDLNALLIRCGLNE